MQSGRTSQRTITLAAWALGTTSTGVLVTAALLWESDVQSDGLTAVGVLLTMVLSGTVIDALPVGWTRHGGSWLTHTASGVWIGVALVSVPAPEFVLLASTCRALKLVWLATAGDGVSRPVLDVPRIVANLGLTTIPAAGAVVATTWLQAPDVIIGALGALVYGGTSTLLIGVLTRGGHSASTSIVRRLRQWWGVLTVEVLATIPSVLVARELGVWVATGVLAGVVVLLWRQAVELQHYSSISIALLDLSSAASEAATVSELRSAVDTAGRQLLGRPIALLGPDGQGSEEAAVLDLDLPGPEGWRLVVGQSAQEWPLRIGPYERRALDGLVSTAGMGVTTLLSRRQLADQAVRDELSGLLNRRGFLGQARRVLRRNATAGSSTTVTFIDLDGFKRVNDTQGHDVGDALIGQVGELLRESMRPADVIGRLGGDEFAVMFADEVPDDVAVDRVSTALRGLSHGVSASIGSATGTSEDLKTVLARADAAMYRAKEARKASRPT